MLFVLGGGAFVIAFAVVAVVIVIVVAIVAAVAVVLFCGVVTSLNAWCWLGPESRNSIDSDAEAWKQHCLKGLHRQHYKCSSCSIQAQRELL